MDRTDTDDLLRALFHVMARNAIPPEALRAIVATGRGSSQQVAAYNLCDGTRSQRSIAKALRLDEGNFSRTLSRWQQMGVVFRIGSDDKPLHLYPLT